VAAFGVQIRHGITLLPSRARTAAVPSMLPIPPYAPAIARKLAFDRQGRSMPDAMGGGSKSR
jgi:hypothetical protein